MKKLISVLMGIVIFASISCLSVYASDYTLEVENGEIDDYGNITATIIISENSGIYNGEFNFLYNSSYFELGEIELNQSGTNGKIETQADTENGVVTFTYKANDEAGCTFGGEFATLNMRLVSTPESVVSFNLDMANTTDYEGNALEATYKITPIEVPISFIVTETQAQTEQTESVEATTESSKDEEESGGFLSALWTVIKVILIIIIVIVVLLIVASFFTRRYFKKKRQRQRQSIRNAQNRQ